MWEQGSDGAVSRGQEEPYPRACGFTESIETLTGVGGFTKSTICAPLVSLPCCLPSFLRVLFPWGALFLAILALGKWLMQHKSPVLGQVFQP